MIRQWVFKIAALRQETFEFSFSLDHPTWDETSEIHLRSPNKYLQHQHPDLDLITAGSLLAFGFFFSLRAIQTPRYPWRQPQLILHVHKVTGLRLYVLAQASDLEERSRAVASP